MGLRLAWTEAGDAALLQLRGAGRTWDQVAAALGVSRNAALNRATALRKGTALPAAAAAPAKVQGGEEDDEVAEERPPLPAGHPISWGVLTEGTYLEGNAYPFRTFP